MRNHAICVRGALGLMAAGIGAAALWALPAGSARAQTLADALVAAYQTNPTLQIGRAQLKQADERVAQARSELLPDVTATVTGTVSSDGAAETFRNADRDFRPDASVDARITGTVTLWSGGRNPANIASAIASVMAARARLTSIEQDVLLGAVTAFMDVRRDLQFVTLARNNVRVNGELLRATRDRFEVGEVTRTDVSQAEAALAAARANLAQNTGALAQSRARFLSVVGLEAKDLAPPPPAPDLPGTLAEAEAIAMREHPALIAARHAEEAAMHDVELARAGLNPILTLTGSVFYQRQLPLVRQRFSADNAGAEIQLQLQVPLYRGGELSSLIRQAQALVEQRKSETQDTARSIRQAVQSAWSALEVARASIRSNGEQVRAQELAFQGVVEEAKFGQRTTLDVLQAEQFLLQARSNLVAAQRDAYVAAYNLLSAMGLLTVAHLGLNVTPYDPTVNYDMAVQNRPDPEGLRLERILDRWGR